MTLLAPVAVSFVITVLAILTLRPLAVSLELVDRPGGRKTHHGVVPLVGGLAMFLGIVVALGLLDLPARTGGPLIAALGLLVVIGLLDDRFGLSPWLRLLVHVTAAAALVLLTQTFVRSMGNVLGTGPIALSGWVSTAFSVLVITAAVNAFNMLDGMDGLAGITALNSLLALGWLGQVTGLGVERAICAVMCASVAGFLLFNLPSPLNRRLRCFMGDAGSTLLGVAIGWLCIRVGQAPTATGIHTVTVLWAVALPLFELLWTTIRRLSRGQSPLHADALHFHHLVMRAGFGVRGAFGLFAVLNALLAGIGIGLRRLDAPDWLSFTLLLVVGALLIRGINNADLMARLLMRTALRRHTVRA
jgi:UDP-GlcNAc:undecaprenyl-phosphate/decaprenyl-phosphate GlcNAc-1-phosphate transferase